MPSTDTIATHRNCETSGHLYVVHEHGFRCDVCGVVSRHPDHSAGIAAAPPREGAGTTQREDGVSLIAAERRRQVEAHGFTAERDDAYTNGEMAMAATHYAMIEFDYSCHGDMFWPASWDSRWDQKDEDDRITQLVKAGALIAAEIDRLQRAATPSSESRQ